MPNLTPLEAAENLEYIDKAVLIKGIGRQYDNLRASVTVAASCLRKIAAGEYVPVVHAHWIHKDCEGIPTENHESISYAECSNCGHEIHNVDREAERCPSCGSLMGGDNNHEQK